MTDYLTESEQLEILKNWIKQYGLVILLGFLIAVVAAAGWRYWQQSHDKMLAGASSTYDEMIAMQSQNNDAASVEEAKKIIAHYPSSVYSQLSALMLAKDAVAKHNYKLAEKELKQALNNSSVPSLRQITRLRLARLFISEHNPGKSIKILEVVDDTTFNGLIAEVKGDAYLALHNTAKARELYHLALLHLPNAETMRPMLQMKYDNLSD